MNAEELAQFTVLAKKFEPKDQEAVLKVLKGDLHPVFQAAHDEGHSAATTRGNAKVTELTTQLTAATAKVTALEGEVTQLKDKQPADVKTLTAQHEAQVRDLTAKHESTVNELKSAHGATLVGTKVQEVVTELVLNYNIDPEYAQTVLTKRDDVVGRFKPNQAGGVDILQKGKDIAITPTSEKTAAQLVAAELAADVPAKWKVSKVNRGSGTNGAGGAGEESRFEAIRADVKASSTKKQEARKESALDRLGGRR